MPKLSWCSQDLTVVSSRFYHWSTFKVTQRHKNPLSRIVTTLALARPKDKGTTYNNLDKSFLLRRTACSIGVLFLQITRVDVTSIVLVLVGIGEF